MLRALSAVAVGGLLVIASGSATLSAPPGGGGQLAFHSELNGKDSEIYLVDLAKLGSPVNLTNNPAKDVSPAWSPNGKELAFASDRSGSSKIYVMNPVSKSVTVLTLSGPASQSNPAWCTDTTIAFSAGGDIFIADRSSGGATNLTNSPGSTESQPACTPDGTRILFASGTASTRGIFDISYVGRIGSPRQISSPGWVTVDPAVNSTGTELVFFGRSPEGKQGLFSNRYKLDDTVNWNPKLRYEAPPPRELRLTKYNPQLGFSWTPQFKSRSSWLFGTDLPQGSAASTGTRSLFFFDYSRKAFQDLGYRSRFGEDANPAKRPLPTVYSRKNFVGIGGTTGADNLTFTFAKTIGVKSPNGLIERFFTDPDRTVIRSGYSIAYEPPFMNIIASMGSGNDRVTITVTGPPPAKKPVPKWLLDCAKGRDQVLIQKAAEPFFGFRSCEQITRR